MAKRKLMSITLTYNNWTEIPEDMFSSFNESKLSKIDLKYNKLRFIHFATFQHLYHLQYLKLSDNKIKRIFMAKVPNLLFLSLDRNLLEKVPKWCVVESMMPKLQSLRLDENKIGDIGPNSFLGKCLPNIESLSLQRNPFGRIQNNVFATLPNLTTLMLTRVGNTLKIIQDYAFNSSSLTTLHLDETGFHFDKNRFNPKTIFNYCQNLQNLDLSHNILPQNVTILQEMLQPLQNLKNLTLKKTGLLGIPEHLFTHMTLLQTLNLRSNRISEWKDGTTIFRNMTNLRNLDLSSNLIPVINKTSFPENMLLSLKTLHLGKNPFSCTCDQLWFLNWSKKTKVKLVNFDQCKCFHPVSMNGIRLKNYHPTEDSCTPWNPIKTVIILSVVIVTTVLLSMVIIFKCQTNIKNLIYLFRLSISQRNGYIPLENTDDFEYHAFVVYCDADRKWVHSVFLQKIETEELMKVCIHHRDFEVGKPIIGNIDKYLKKSRKVVVIMSNEFAKSEWCQWEIDVVQERRRRQGSDIFILIALKPIDSKHMTSHLRTLLASSGQVQYRKGIGEDLFWKAVVEGLRKPIGHPPIAVL